MQHSRFVHPCQSLQKRDHHCQQVRLLEGLPRCLARLEQRRQRQGLLEVHHQVSRTAGPKEVPAGNDVRVSSEADQLPCFLLKATQALFEQAPGVRAPGLHRPALAHRQLHRQILLDGNQAQVAVQGTVHDSETALPQFGFHRVDPVQHGPWRQSMVRLCLLQRLSSFPFD